MRLRILSNPDFKVKFADQEAAECLRNYMTIEIEGEGHCNFTQVYGLACPLFVMTKEEAKVWREAVHWFIKACESKGWRDIRPQVDND